MNADIGKDAEIGDYVLIGHGEGEKTVIGDNAKIRSHTVIYAGTKIGNNFQTGHGVLVREKNEIGNDVSIGSHTVVEHSVKIGNNVRIHSSAEIPEYTVLEDDVWIGPQAVLTNSRYPRSKNSKETRKGPLIKKNAKIGANATILPGVTIGENALVGAGSVVTKDVPASKVVVGNPAHVIKDIAELEVYE